MLAASAPAGPLEVADDPCQVILSATGLVARTAAESRGGVRGPAPQRPGQARRGPRGGALHRPRPGAAGDQPGRAFKIDVLPLPVLPEQAGTVSLRGGMSASELVPLRAGGAGRRPGPARRADRRLAGPGAGHPAGRGEGLRAGVAGALRRVRGHHASRTATRCVGATWLTDGTETLVFVTSDASLLRFAAGLVRPQGLKGGGMAGINLARRRRGDRSSARSAPTTRSTASRWWSPRPARTVKVTPFAEYPAKGRATGGVRVQRFLKGETGWRWPGWGRGRPAATETGDPVDLPPLDPRRDGSGYAVMMLPGVVGQLVERD